VFAIKDVIFAKDFNDPVIRQTQPNNPNYSDPLANEVCGWFEFGKCVSLSNLPSG